MGLPPARLDHRGGVVGPADQQHRVVVDGVVAVAGADGGADPHRPRVAEQVAGGVDGVDAHVEQGPASGQRRVGEPPGRPPAGVAAVAAGLDDRAQLAGLDPGPQGPDVGVEPPAVGHHQPCPAAAGGRHHGVGLGHGGGHRLLHQHVLAGLQEGDRLGGVEAVGGADHGRVDLGVGGQGAPVGGHPGDAVALGQPAQGRLAPVGRRHQLGARVLERRPGVEVHDPAGPDQRDPKAAGSRHPLTPVRVTPSTNTFWARKKITSTGSVNRIGRPSGGWPGSPATTG